MYTVSWKDSNGGDQSLSGSKEELKAFVESLKTQGVEHEVKTDGSEAAKKTAAPKRAGSVKEDK